MTTRAIVALNINGSWFRVGSEITHRIVTKIEQDHPFYILYSDDDLLAVVPVAIAIAYYDAPKEPMMTQSEIIKLVKEVGILTGSRAFGVHANDNADHDYILRAVDWCRIWGDNQPEDFYKTYGVGTCSYYLQDDNGDDVNVIVTQDDMEFLAWLYATEKMKADPIKDKKDRVHIFENDRHSIYKMCKRHEGLIL